MHLSSVSQSEKEVARDMFHFLQSFFAVFDDLKGLPLFICKQ